MDIVKNPISLTTRNTGGTYCTSTTHTRPEMWGTSGGRSGKEDKLNFLMYNNETLVYILEYLKNYSVFICKWYNKCLFKEMLPWWSGTCPSFECGCGCAASHERILVGSPSWCLSAHRWPPRSTQGSTRVQPVPAQSQKATRRLAGLTSECTFTSWAQVFLLVWAGPDCHCPIQCPSVLASIWAPVGVLVIKWVWCVADSLLFRGSGKWLPFW